MDPDVLWRLDRYGRVKSRVCTTAHGLFLLLTAESIRLWDAKFVRMHGRTIFPDFAFFHPTTVISSQPR